MTAEGAKYIIITHDNFYNTILPIAHWKTKKGVLTKVIPSSVTGDTNTQIKDYIVNAYNTWNPRPEYVLLVGSTSHLPAWQGYPSVYPISDNPYGDVNNDTITEVIIGRFPCSSITECSTMIEKTFAYERTPSVIDTGWFKRATTIRQEPGLIHNAGVHFVCSLMVNYGNFSSNDIDTFIDPPHNYINVINALNQGRSYLLYTGHGNQTAWFYPFDVRPESLRNNSKLSVVVAWCCWGGLAGDLGKRWLNARRTDSLIGSVIYIGTSGTGDALYRNHIARNIFRAIFQHHKSTIGLAFQEGKDSLWAFYRTGACSSDTAYKYYCDFNLLGDPELNLWTKVPKPLAVAHDNYIQTGIDTFTVTVTDSNTNATIENALVCVMMPSDTSLYYYGYTNSAGIKSFFINPKWAPDSICVTVTAQNYIPYEGKCLVIDTLLATESATFPNQGRHIIHKPNTSELHIVYENNGSIYYSNSPNWGQNWIKPKYLGDGSYPCIAIGPKGGTPWVMWGSAEEYGPIYSAVKRPAPDTTWKIRELFPFGEYEVNVTSPAMVLTTLEDEDGDMAYSVFRTYDRIYFGAFDSLHDYYIYEVDNYDPCYAPSISVTPGDYIHIVWQRGDDEVDGKIYYTTTEDFITPEMIRDDNDPKWTNTFKISTEDPKSEPASNPFSETYGDSVYAVWRGPNALYDSTLGDIWRRVRWMENEYNNWYSPTNISQTQNDESNYPVMSTNLVTVWHEQVDTTNWDIWGKFKSEQSSEPIFETQNPSKYPQITSYWDPNPTIPPTFCCNSIWTEAIDSNSYEVKFDCNRYEYNPPEERTVEKFPPYYVVGIGNSIQSPYCLERSGYFQYSPYSIDYGYQHLKYQLPYLNPQYYYNLRAITYNRSNNNWQEQFYIDSILHLNVTYEPDKPETVWIRIPQESYNQDAKVLQKIGKVIGNWAVIADLRLYQTESLQTNQTSGSIQGSGISVVQKPILFQSYPNPSKSEMTIQYSIPTKSKVTLIVYDISGRAVRTLVNENKEPGSYSILWNGNDNNHRTCAQGIYFCRLRTAEFAENKRLVLIR
jgi:hypothetical protein